MNNPMKGTTYENYFGHIEASKRKKFLRDSVKNGGLLRKMNKARQGRSYFDIYGEEKGKEVAKAISKSLFGYRKYNNIRKKRCLVCGKIMSKPYFLSYKNWKKKKFCDNKCHGKYIKGKLYEEIMKNKKRAIKHIKSLSGKNSHLYKGGINKFSNTNRTRKLIMKRDKGICQLCFKKVFINEKDERKIWNCHHIHHNSKDKDLKTIVLLHHSCHTKTRFNRDYWFAYFCYQKNIEPGDIIA